MKNKITKIKKCRICKNKELKPVISLGNMMATGIFPKNKKNLYSMPIDLVLCVKKNKNNCGLLQLNHTVPSDLLYGKNYGYRSGLNSSMASHIKKTSEYFSKKYLPQKNEFILDIGSNDGTLLNHLKFLGYSNLVGVDPTINKFKKFYKKEIKTISKLFNEKLIENNTNFKNKFKFIFSLSMFYDLDDPVIFCKLISKIMDKESFWFFEQSYLPSMLDTNSFDTICHEHLEYYSLTQIKWIFDRVGLFLKTVKLNKINGGSFSILATNNKNCISKQESKKVIQILNKEIKFNLNKIATYKNFYKKIVKLKHQLLNLIHKLIKEKKKVLLYGASTKGNVLLQFYEINSKLIPNILEVNEDKFGKITPKSNIKIISETNGFEQKPDYLIVLPWHFKKNILSKSNSKKFMNRGGKFIFPLPKVEIIGKK